MSTRAERRAAGQAGTPDSGTAHAAAFRSDGLLSEGVEHLDSGQLKVLDVAGDHGHVVHPRRCCNERVDHREGLIVLRTAPGSADREGDRENPVFEPGLPTPDPALEGASLVPVSPAANSRDPL